MDAILTDLLPRMEARAAEIRCALHCAAMQSPSKAPLSLLEARRLSALMASTLSKLRSAIDAELESYQPQEAARAMFSASVAELDMRDRVFMRGDGPVNSEGRKTAPSGPQSNT